MGAARSAPRARELAAPGAAASGHGPEPPPRTQGCGTSSCPSNSVHALAVTGAHLRDSGPGRRSSNASGPASASEKRPGPHAGTTLPRARAARRGMVHQAALPAFLPRLPLPRPSAHLAAAVKHTFPRQRRPALREVTLAGRRRCAGIVSPPGPAASTAPAARRRGAALRSRVDRDLCIEYTEGIKAMRARSPRRSGRPGAQNPAGSNGREGCTRARTALLRKGTRQQCSGPGFDCRRVAVCWRRRVRSAARIWPAAGIPCTARISVDSTGKNI